MMRIFIILIFILFPVTIFSQENPTMEAKNSLMFDCADVIITGNFAVNYERQFYSTHSFRSMINIGLGGWYSFINNSRVDIGHVASGYSVPFTLNTITGLGKHHFECDFGVRLLMDKRWNTFQDNGVEQIEPTLDKSVVKPVFNVGYRYHKMNGKLIFRAFMGLGGFGLGIGSAF